MNELVRSVAIATQFNIRDDYLTNYATLYASREAMLKALVAINMSYLSSHPEIPSLYDLGRKGKVRVIEDSVKFSGENEIDQFNDIPSTIKRGGGDCEDLACWRCAEIRLAGVNAVPRMLIGADLNGKPFAHAVIATYDGITMMIEDPRLAVKYKEPMKEKAPDALIELLLMADKYQALTFKPAFIPTDKLY